jgi:hypothetical protein
MVKLSAGARASSERAARRRSTATFFMYTSVAKTRPTGDDPVAGSGLARRFSRCIHDHEAGYLPKLPHKKHVSDKRARAQNRS